MRVSISLFHDRHPLMHWRERNIESEVSLAAVVRKKERREGGSVERERDAHLVPSSLFPLLLPRFPVE